MDTRTLHVLEYYRIRSEIARFAMSEEGKATVEQKEPLTDEAAIQSEKSLVAEWMNALQSQKPPVLRGFAPCERLFSVLSVHDAVLECDEIFTLAQFALSVQKLCASVVECGGGTNGVSLPLLTARCELLPDFSPALAEIFHILDENGQIRDLPELRAIRANIAKIRRDIASLLKSYTTDNALKDALQSDMPTIRGERQVLAVKSNFRGRVKGIVHELSQTGQTAYIEPEDVVQRNNDLMQEENRLALEIRRILRELTARLGTYKEQFESAHTVMIHLDSLYAAARWGIENRCVLAENPTQEKPFSLNQARHPLLGIAAVPIDLAFAPNTRLIIITGPNTGGKTVTLKTAALFVALNQSGFPVPAAEGTHLPIFDNIFADIGDEQSIDQSLSTFSSHMKNIAHMADNATNRTLLLLDELGSGTDPQEGGAVAMAVLDFMLQKGATALITTHHGILKNYGYTHRECMNASVDFDETTLSPTYRIIMGVPGESRALEIASRSGLCRAITDKAKEYLVTEQADVSALIRGLTAKHEELDALERKGKKEEQAIREKRRRVDLKELQLRQKELELREQGYRKLASFAEESRRELENLVRHLREGEITREKTRAVKEYIAHLSEALDGEKEALQQEQTEVARQNAELQSLLAAEKASRRALNKAERAEASRVEYMKAQLARYGDGSADGVGVANGTAYPQTFAEGVDVFVNGTRGTLVRKNKNNSWVVRLGALKMNVSESKLVLAPIQSLKADTQSLSIELETSSTDNAGIPGAQFDIVQEKPVTELRLLGMRYEEAMKAVEKQIDLAVLNRLCSFSIVHGKGTGVLQQGVQRYLASCAAVAEYGFARPEDGGFGKTYVTLKDV